MVADESHDLTLKLHVIADGSSITTTNIIVRTTPGTVPQARRNLSA